MGGLSASLALGTPASILQIARIGAAISRGKLRTTTRGNKNHENRDEKGPTEGANSGAPITRHLTKRLQSYSATRVARVQWNAKKKNWLHNSPKLGDLYGRLGH